jgi:hypothetical protein
VNAGSINSRDFRVETGSSMSPWRAEVLIPVSSVGSWRAEVLVPGLLQAPLRTDFFPMSFTHTFPHQKLHVDVTCRLVCPGFCCPLDKGVFVGSIT